MNDTETSGEDSADVPPNAADTDPDDTVVVRTTTTTRTQPRTCAACGTALTQPAVGRPRRWCSPACRTRGWAHRHTAGTTPPEQVVHDRVTTTRRVLEARLPRTGREWHTTLDGLLDQLADEHSVIRLLNYDIEFIGEKLERASLLIAELQAHQEDRNRAYQATVDAQRREIYGVHIPRPTAVDDTEIGVDEGANVASPELSRQQRRARERERTKNLPPPQRLW
ncbi:hypothetical protein [Amycolatopsis minnesotensis]|uniref:Uncharacterized protein n=1 Tax=Amycolatopsis minnesotensis TaxID=337894 RepID=A0ABN2SAG9_9PSEU